MTVPVTPEQQNLRAQIQQILGAVTPLWDNPNPGAHEEAMVSSCLIGVSLSNPAYAGVLALFNKIATVITTDPDRAKLLDLLMDQAPDSTEYELIKFMLGDGNTMPSWGEVAAKIVELAVAEVQPAPVAAPIPAPAPAPQPTPMSPAQLLAKLNPPPTAPTSRLSPSRPPPPISPPLGPRAASRRGSKGVRGSTPQ